MDPPRRLVRIAVIGAGEGLAIIETTWAEAGRVRRRTVTESYATLESLQIRLAELAGQLRGSAGEIGLEQTERSNQDAGGGRLADAAAGPTLLDRPILQGLLEPDDMPQRRTARRR
jgi:hypothetical protein